MARIKQANSSGRKANREQGHIGFLLPPIVSIFRKKEGGSGEPPRENRKHILRMGRFKKFDFEHTAFVNSQEPLKDFMRRAYLSNMNCSEFIEAILALKISTRGRSRHNRQYRNHHAIAEMYERLDGKFNFFGNYKD
jgi:hypothetical protein